MDKKKAPHKGGKPTTAQLIPELGYVSEDEKEDLLAQLREMNLTPEQLRDNPALAELLAEHLSQRLIERRKARRFFGMF